MGDLKPLGSERLKSDEKLKRILELTYYKNNNSKSEKKAELVKESKSGGIYGIVKEKDAYYVKRGLNENTLDYIGGIFMKNKNRFNSYAEALKRLELIKGQEELQEATKYVLKQNKDQQEAPPSEPTMDVPPPPPAPTDDAGVPPSPEGSDAPPPPSGDEMPPAPEGEPSSDETKPEGEGSGKRSDYMAEVQKYAGKLGQELRDLHDRMESDDIKYVLNMIISAVDLDKLEEEDIEEIAKKFEREEEEMGDDDVAPSPAEDAPSGEDESEPKEPSGEEELGEDGDPMSALERFVNAKAVSSDDAPMVGATEVDLSKFAMHEDDDLKELDLDEIKSQISHAVGETLSKYFK